MPSTYSPNLRIELIASGEQANTWGVTTNNNLGTLIGDAIAGLTSVDVTAADVTLTALDGLQDQARNMMITVSGTPGTARSVFCPDGDTKVYVVANDSNAAVTFSTVSGTGVDIPVGTSKFLYCDGTDVFEAVTAIDTLLLGGAPTTSLEAANKGYVDAAIAAINYTANRAVVTNGSGNLAASATTSTEIGYVSGVTSAIQTQLNNKPSLTGSGASGTWGINISGNAATASAGVTNTGFVASNFDAAGYCYRAVAGAAGTQAIIQWTNTAQSAQWTSLVGTNGNLQCTTAFSASSFSGAGTGLTGTASSLSIGGNAATVTNGVYNNGGTYNINISGNAATASNPASGGSFITSSNIGSQSVNYATSAGSASSATNATNATNALGGPTSGQSWQNVLASRAAGTTYTNSTGKPIEVSISTESNGSAGNDARCYVDSVNVSWFGIDGGATAANQQVFVVPNGSTYRVTISGGMSLALWAELR